MELAKIETSSIFTPISENNMSVAMAGAVVPFTGILCDFVGLHLDSTPMSNSDQLWDELFINLADVFNN